MVFKVWRGFRCCRCCHCCRCCIGSTSDLPNGSEWNDSASSKPSFKHKSCCKVSWTKILFSVHFLSEFFLSIDFSTAHHLMARGFTIQITELSVRIYFQVRNYEIIHKVINMKTCTAFFLSSPFKYRYSTLVDPFLEHPLKDVIKTWLLTQHVNGISPTI